MADKEKTRFKVSFDPFWSCNNQDLDENYLALAKEYFDEDPKTVKEKVSELKEVMIENDIKLPRDDEAYVLKFLRAGGGKVDAALEVRKILSGIFHCAFSQYFSLMYRS